MPTQRDRNPNDKIYEGVNMSLDEVVIDNPRLTVQESTNEERPLDQNTDDSPSSWRVTVENTSFVLIIINSIMMGIGTFDFVTKDDLVNDIFYYSDLTFLSLFTIELVLTIFYWGESPLKHRWVMFDFLIIGISWILTIQNFIDSSQGSGVQVVRCLRIFRILVRIESWRAFLNAVGRSLPRLGCLAIFTTIIMFIFAVFFTEQYRDMYDKGQTELDYFSRLDLTFFTLYQLLTLDNWINVLREVMLTHPHAWIPFVLYITLTSIILVNLAIAIICESIFEVLQRQEECQKLRRKMKNMRYLKAIKLQCNVLIDQLDLQRSEQAVDIVADGNDKSTETCDYVKRKSGTGTSLTSLFVDDGTIDENESECFAVFRNQCGRIVNDKYVQWFVVLIIFTNSLLLALETFDFVTKNPSTASAFATTNTVFLAFYTVENAMQLVYHGPRRMFSDGWLTFDFILIVFSWSSSLTPAFRIFRVLRIIHVIPKFEAMLTITGTLYAAIPKISATSGILLVLYYVFGVMFTTLFKDVPVGCDGCLSEEFFSRLDKTILTLFQLMTMEDWATPSRELVEYYWWAHYVLSLFLTLTGLLFINAIIALICEAYNDYATAKVEVKTALEEKKFDDEIFKLIAVHADILEILQESNAPLEIS